MSCMRKFVSALRIVECTISLGGCHTTLCLPCETSHAALSEEERSALGLGADCFRCDGCSYIYTAQTLALHRDSRAQIVAPRRLSVGIEDVDDLLEDFKRALHAVGSAVC